MIDLKAIPTEYRGIQLRSRLEAQCAFLLDKLGWEWRYEPFSLMLPNGETMTPDFWVPRFSLVIECRGYRSERGDSQLAGLGQLVGRDLRFGRLMLIGPEECSSKAAGTSAESLLLGMCPCGRWFPRDHEHDVVDPEWCKCFVPRFVQAAAMAIEEGKLFLNGFSVGEYPWPT